MEIVYLGPDAEGEEIVGETYVRPPIWCPLGVAVEVPDDIAGRPPKGKPDADGYDPGEGLLALAHKWRPALKKDPRPNAETTDGEEPVNA